MVVSWSHRLFLTIIILPLFTPLSLMIIAENNFDYPSTAIPPVSWLNVSSDYICSSESVCLKPILMKGNFICGFHCSVTGEKSCLFAVSIFNTSSDHNSTTSPFIVWSANRNNPVEVDAVLKFTKEGDLILKDGNGVLVWSTNTASMSVSRLNLTEQGNLVLLDKTNNVIWQSFDHPTDSLVPGQRLSLGKKLRSSISASNSSEGLYSLEINDNGKLIAYLETDPPQLYYKSEYGVARREKMIYAEFSRIASVWFDSGSVNMTSISIIKLGNDGHLKGYQWRNSIWVDLLHIPACNYPLACGKYGFCSESAINPCSCYGEITAHWIPRDDTQLNLGCSLYPPIACELSHEQSLIPLVKHSINAFTLAYYTNNTYEDDCKQACLKSCSCKALIFRQNHFSNTTGDCSLASDVFSFGSGMYYYENFTYRSMFIKVQNIEKNLSSVNPPPKSKGQSKAKILGPTLGGIFGVFVLCILRAILVKICCSRKVEEQEDCLEHIPGLPTRFSYEELKAITKSFSNKLGEGGFGSVFRGTLPAGDEVAVKQLDCFGHINKSFITEVQTIGSFHHFNLVSLVGFCAENFRRLLVYEFMSNGSLDRWIYIKKKEVAVSLSWQSRKKIILDIAKGLAYLHEDCNQKIIHLDIKPQNILLDENFNAKISDFGLSKLIERNQSQVMTNMRGTPGYMAPEWLSSVITEKADVYSFGIVVLEIVCGRPNVDKSQPEEDMHLVSLFKRKAEEEQLEDLVDTSSEDMQSNAAEVMGMMKVVACCLQSQSPKRPSMSEVVKVLEGSIDNIERCFSYDFSNLPGPDDVSLVSLTLPSFLSGPR